MFIITIQGHEKEGSYSVIDEDGEEVLYIFEEEDDQSVILFSWRRWITLR